MNKAQRNCDAKDRARLSFVATRLFHAASNGVRWGSSHGTARKFVIKKKTI